MSDHTGSIPVQFCIFAYSEQMFIESVSVVHITKKRQHVLIDYTTTNQTYGANYRVTSERYM